MTDAPRPPEEAIAHRRRRVRADPDQQQRRRGLIRAAPASSLETHGEDWERRHWSSRALHRMGELSAHAGAGLVAAFAVVGWLTFGVAYDFPDWWEKALYATSSSVTLVMVFAIQHTQTRQQSATQRKLDELLRADTAADDSLIAVEEATDHELQARADLNLADRQEAAGHDG